MHSVCEGTLETSIRGVAFHVIFQCILYLLISTLLHHIALKPDFNRARHKATEKKKVMCGTIRTYRHIILL